MISGSLRNVPLSDVFQIISTSQKSGILTVSHRERRARIYFELGRIQYAYISPGVHLGEILVRMDLMTSFEVQSILVKQKTQNAGTPLGLTAIDSGYITEEDLRKALRVQIIEVLTDLMFWRSGNFHFAEKSLSTSQVPTEHAFEAVTLLMDVVAQVDNWKQGGVTPDAVFERAGDPTKLTLPDGSWEVLGYVNGLRSAASIAAELDLSEKQVFHILYVLEETGVIVPSRFPVEEPLILIVSESSAFQRLIRLSLHRAGLKATIVDKPEDALDFLEENYPKAIILDEKGGESWDFVNELRSLSGRSHLPILMLSDSDAPPRKGFFSRFRKPKAQVLTKPFQETDFQRLVSQLAGKSLV